MRDIKLILRLHRGYIRYFIVLSLKSNMVGRINQRNFEHKGLNRLKSNTVNCAFPG